MIDISNYVVDGIVKRDKIVADIKRCRIGKKEILELNNDPRILGIYFGTREVERKNQDAWNSRYLDELSLVSIGKMFNMEYMLYLSEVANYIAEGERKKKQKEKRVKVVVIIAIISIFIICAILCVASKDKKEKVQLLVNNDILEEKYVSVFR